MNMAQNFFAKHNRMPTMTEAEENGMVEGYRDDLLVIIFPDESALQESIDGIVTPAESLYMDRYA